MWRNEQSVVETVPQACATLVESFSHKILTRHKIYEKLLEKRLKPSFGDCRVQHEKPVIIRL